MNAAEVMTRLATTIDDHRWDRLAELLHEDFTCHYVHTGERFDRDTWVRFNADYPGFDHFTLEDCVAAGNRAAGRAHVTGYVDQELQHFEVATFLTIDGGLITEMTEVWTDVNAQVPQGTRPA